SATISTALPFSIVMLVLVWSLFVGMKADVANSQTQAGAMPQAYPVSGMAWQKRLALMLRTPDAREIDRFLENVASPALQAVAKELQARSRAAEVEVDRETGTVTLTAPADDVRNFVYGVRRTEQKLPAFTAYDATRANSRYEAYTFFSDGSR